MWGKSKDTDARRKVKIKCTHYWLIENPTRPTSRGVCKLCGVEREFRNLMPYRLVGSTVCDTGDLPDVQDVE